MIFRQFLAALTIQQKYFKLLNISHCEKNKVCNILAHTTPGCRYLQAKATKCVESEFTKNDKIL